VFNSNQSLNPDQVLRVNNVAKRLSLPERTVRHMAARGRIPAFKVGRRAWSFRASDVDAHLISRRLGARA
jgi:excisionase family DNA binding protein